MCRPGIPVARHLIDLPQRDATDAMHRDHPLRRQNQREAALTKRVLFSQLGNSDRVGSGSVFDQFPG
jgi:hypothetical protein